VPRTHKPIPLCKSDFLQDVTIALGRRSLKSIRQQYARLDFEVSFDKDKSERFERLEHFHKSCSDVLVCPMDSGLFGFWLRFASVTEFFKPAPSPKPRQKPKILAAHRYIFSVNALDIEARGWDCSILKITLWEDGAAWLYLREGSGERKTEQRANFWGMNAEGIAEVIRLTLQDFSEAHETWKKYRSSL